MADSENEAVEQGSMVAKIFSGIFFGGLATWLSITNGGSLAFVQKAALEKRLTVCCFLNTYVAMFSTFFNIFQLTNVDDAVLPDNSTFTLDLARPIEWVMTCPLMQLSLVLMGGAKLPEYRRMLMPMFSIVILACGTASTFMTSFGLRILCYVIGCILFIVMATFNRLQIIEYSNGQEGMLQGDSEFRKATLLLLFTWFPFPTWFVLSPEGFGIVNNILLVQVGWAFLNIVAKFVFIFYIQRIKDLYCNRLKTKRELVGTGGSGRKKLFAAFASGAASPPDFEGANGGIVPPSFGDVQAYEAAEKEAKKEKLNAVVIETMTFLGMAQNTERFIRLLEKANVHSVMAVEELSKDKCEALSLPWELIQALQRRINVWKMDLVDEAEAELEKGEEHYIKKIFDTGKEDGMESPKNMGYMQGMGGMGGMQVMGGMQGMNGMPGMNGMQNMPNMVPYGQDYNQGHNLSHQASMGGAPALADNNDIGSIGIPAEVLEDMLAKAEARIADNHKSQSANDVDTVAQTMEKMMVQMMDSIIDKVQTELTAVEKRLHTQIDAVSKTAEHRAELRAFENRVNLRLDEVSKGKDVNDTVAELEKRVTSHVEQHTSQVSAKVDNCLQRVELLTRKVESSSLETVQKVNEKLDVGLQQSRQHSEQLQVVQSAQAKIAAQSEAAWRQRLEELENAVTLRQDEMEAQSRKRHDEAIRNSAAKRIEEVAQQVQRASEKANQNSETMNETFASELSSMGTRIISRLDTFQVATAKQQAELDAAMQRTEESIARKLNNAVEAGLADSAKKAAADALSRMEKVGEQLEANLAKKLTTSVEQAVQGGAQNGSNITTHRMEKALESFESTQRAELMAQTSNFLERLDEMNNTNARKGGEREERQMRRIEELMEVTTNRGVQKTEDVGLELKKELHGFAKRLNTKIPFM